MCSLHRKLLDKGVLGIGDSHRVLVSQRFAGSSAVAGQQVISLAGCPLTGPQPGTRPSPRPTALAHQPGLPRHSARCHCDLCKDTALGLLIDALCPVPPAGHNRVDTDDGTNVPLCCAIARRVRTRHTVLLARGRYGRQLLAEAELHRRLTIGAYAGGASA